MKGNVQRVLLECLVRALTATIILVDFHFSSEISVRIHSTCTHACFQAEQLHLERTGRLFDTHTDSVFIRLINHGMYRSKSKI
jgi:hypothetical protein